MVNAADIQMGSLLRLNWKDQIPQEHLKNTSIKFKAYGHPVLVISPEPRPDLINVIMLTSFKGKNIFDVYNTTNTVHLIENYMPIAPLSSHSYYTPLEFADDMKSTKQGHLFIGRVFGVHQDMLVQWEQSGGELRPGPDRLTAESWIHVAQTLCVRRPRSFLVYDRKKLSEANVELDKLRDLFSLMHAQPGALINGSNSIHVSGEQQPLLSAISARTSSKYLRRDRVRRYCENRLRRFVEIESVTSTIRDASHRAHSPSLEAPDDRGHDSSLCNFLIVGTVTAFALHMIEIPKRLLSWRSMCWFGSYLTELFWQIIHFFMCTGRGS